MSDGWVVVVNDPRLSTEARVAALYVASMGDGAHEISNDAFKIVLNQAGRGKIEDALRLCQRLGYLAVDILKGPTRYRCQASLPPREEWTTRSFKNTRRIPPEVREAVHQRDGDTCQLCGEDTDGDTHLDHIVPWSKYGTHEPENLRVTCGPCNLKRGAGE